jgi:protein-S-isoprenylcysteine O-methyltransferase Ste14
VILTGALGSAPVGGRTPAAAGLTLATVVALFAIDVVWVKVRTGRAEQNVFRLAARDWTILPIQLATFAGFAVVLSAPRAVPALDMPGTPWIPTIAGVIVAALGIGLRVWAIGTLGPAFSRVVRVEVDQRLVVNGPYRVIRHPSYTGLLLAFVGIGTMTGNWLGLAAMAVIPTIGYVIRIFSEERTLASKMGDRCVQYARGRARLIPGVW